MLSRHRRASLSYEVLCLSLPDICVNKLCVGRPKDYDFIFSVVSGGYITMEEIESLAGRVKENFRKMLAKNIEKSKEFIRQNQTRSSQLLAKT